MSDEEIKALIRTTAGAPILEPEAHPASGVGFFTPGSMLVVSGPPNEPLMTFAEIGQHRFAVLDELGFGKPERRAERAVGLTADDRSALDEICIGLGKATFDRVRSKARDPRAATMVWAPDAQPHRVPGQTLLWAHHYLVPDRLGEIILQGTSLDDLGKAISQLYHLRPLIERGLVVPLLETHLVGPEPVELSVLRDLTDPKIRSWLDEQLIVEGPTAREALLISARDDNRGPQPFFFPYLQPGDQDTDQLIVTESMVSYLGREYDSEKDYGQFIQDCREMAAAILLREINVAVGLSIATRARLVTASPFRARLLAMKNAAIDSAAAALMWADVPVLADASPEDLAYLADEEETVQALREDVRQAFARSGQDAESAAEDARELIERIRNSTGKFERRMDAARRGHVRSGVLIAGSLAIAAATDSWPGAVGAGLQAWHHRGQYRDIQREQKGHAAYAFVSLKRRADSRSGRRIERHARGA